MPPYPPPRCQCPELGAVCPACRAYAQAHPHPGALRPPPALVSTRVKALYARRKAQGVCPRCGHMPVAGGRWCAGCRARARVACAKLRRRRRAGE